MLFGLLLLAICIVAFQHMVLATKWLVSQQLLDRATQAAVLSGAHFQARILNNHALLNRTQMAHQVAMAHLITVASALHQAHQMQRQVKRMNPPLYLIGAFFGARHAAAYAASGLTVPSSSSGALRRLKHSFQGHDKLVRYQVEKDRQLLMANFDAKTELIINETFKQNIKREGLFDQITAMGGIHFEPNMQLNLLQTGVNHQDLVRDHHLASWQPWLDQVITQHDYLKPRNDTVRNHWIINPKCPHMRHALRREGETTVSASGQFEATDSLSFHAMRQFHPVGCYLREYPMGWADISTAALSPIHIGNSAPRRFNQTSFRKWAEWAVENVGWLIGIPRNNLANNWAKRQRQSWHTEVPPEPTLLKNRHKRFILTLSASLKKDWFSQTHTRVNWRTLGLQKLSDLLSPKKLSAEFSAEVYFSQLDDDSHYTKQEPSLYQSFWQAKRVRGQHD